MSIANAAPFDRVQLRHLAINNLVQWGDHLSVNHSGIDAQHKAIFELGTKIHENWRVGAKVNVLRSAIDKLAILLEAHFSYEEKLLAEIDYKELVPHAAEHRSMLKDLKALQDHFHALVGETDSSGGSILAPGWSAMLFVLGFAIGHVSTSDMNYFQPLQASRNSEQGTVGSA